MRQENQINTEIGEFPVPSVKILPVFSHLVGRVADNDIPQ